MYLFLFALASGVAITSTILAITRLNAAHALIYLVVSLLAVAAVFFLLGAPFAAALEIVIYAGAIVVLFVFVVMMLNIGPGSVERERQWLRPGMWIGPAILSGILFITIWFVIYQPSNPEFWSKEVGPRAVGARLFSAYIVAVELAGILLLASLVGAYHLGRRYLSDRREEE